VEGPHRHQLVTVTTLVHTGSTPILHRVDHLVGVDTPSAHMVDHKVDHVVETAIHKVDRKVGALNSLRCSEPKKP
jgi:hypothetical protein